MILSEKSSGSSACQDLLTRSGRVRHVDKTRHFEHETLYWTKAASILGMPQIAMIDSEVPIPAAKARRDLITLLQDNLEDFRPPADDASLIFDGWRRLCRHYAPVFLEKSPHHLCQWSALELMLRCAEECDDLAFLFVGLVRNPMDTIYSQYTRWGSSPEQVERQWFTAYSNLSKLRPLLGERLVVVRYEDMVASPAILRPVFDFCGIADSSGEGFLHSRSMQKWTSDRLFGFSLSDETLALASEYGYREDELHNRGFLLWPVVRNVTGVRHRIDRFVRRAVRSALAASGLLERARQIRART